MSLVEKALNRLRQVAPQKPVVPGEPVRSFGPADAGLAPQNRVALNRPALRLAGLLPPESDEWRIAADFRQLKRPLLAKALGRGGAEIAPDGHLMMVCSALPGEGKTFTSVNLALSLALETDFATVLVDADLSKPNVSRALGLEGKPGLTDLLQSTALTLGSVLYATDVERLIVLPAGTGAHNATELLSGARMRQIVALLGSRESNRLVVFDTSPLLLTTEPQALATTVGQVVLVVRAGHTQQQAVREAVGQVGNVAKVSLLLNQSNDTAAKGESRYGYYVPSTSASGPGTRS